VFKVFKVDSIIFENLKEENLNLKLTLEKERIRANELETPFKASTSRMNEKMETFQKENVQLRMKYHQNEDIQKDKIALMIKNFKAFVGKIFRKVEMTNNVKKP